MTQEQLNEQLHDAVYANDIEAVRKAIKDGADVNATDELGFPAVIYAVRDEQYEMAKIILDQMVDNQLKQHGVCDEKMEAYND